MKALGNGRFQDDWETITFNANGKNGRGIHRPTGEKYRLERITEVYPPTNIAEYEGSYYSDELDLKLRFVRSKHLHNEVTEVKSVTH